MKSSILMATALAVGFGVALPRDSDVHATKIKQLLRRQGKSPMSPQTINNMFNSKYGKVPAPAGAAPVRAVLEPRAKAAGSKTVKLRYGPYKVPNMKVKNILGEEGALWNYADPGVQKPCDDCTLIGMSAGLEFPDGKNANIDQGLWLHHMVLVNSGPGRVDATCGMLPVSMPHMITGSSPMQSERLFSSGNERTLAVLPSWGPVAENVGYKLKKEDKFALIVDLMNDLMEDKVVWLTMTFDYFEGLKPEFDDMKPVWFDVAQCLTSEWPPPYNKGNYTVPSVTWAATVEGDIIAAAGHLHDGGQNVKLYADGKLACESKATYGGKPEFIAKTAMHPGSATVHVSKMSVCANDDLFVKKMVKGQRWKLTVDYDYDKNKGMTHGNGQQSSVMGIAIMYVRQKNKGAAASAVAGGGETAAKGTAAKGTAAKGTASKGTAAKGAAPKSAEVPAKGTTSKSEER